MGFEDDYIVSTGGFGSTTTVTRRGLGARGVDWMSKKVGGAAESITFPVYDAHGNMVMTVQRTGTRQSGSWVDANHQAYDVWGSVRAATSTNGDLSKMKYCANLGHVEDEESSLIYMRARYYEPWSGRFVSEDPARDGFNWYAYASNCPNMMSDPSGLTTLLDHMQAMLDGAEIESGQGATAQAVKHWGKEKIMDAVAKHSGYLSGYLIGMEIEQAGLTKVGMFFKVHDPVSGKLRQIHIDFVDAHRLGGPHIEFQGAGSSRARIFLDSLGEGLAEALGFRF